MLGLMLMLGITIMVSTIAATVLTTWAMFKFMSTDMFAK